MFSKHDRVEFSISWDTMNCSGEHALLLLHLLLLFVHDFTDDVIGPANKIRNYYDYMMFV